MTEPSVPRLSLRGISKHYGETSANDAIDLDIMPGEIHALLGENGAGKSTLVKIIYGVVRPDAGEIHWEGRAVDITSPNLARQTGIGMVFQHFSLFESLTVVENIALGTDSQVSLKKLAEDISTVARRYGLAVDPHRYVHDLSVGERQRVEIVRCLMQEPRLLILDEPTSVLTPQEVEGLFEMLRRLASAGCSILYISHKLEEIMALCDRATVLRAGRVSGNCEPNRETAESLARMMIGAALPVVRRTVRPEQSAVCLSANALTVPSIDPYGTSLIDIDLKVHSGEIVGIAGVAGNGQSELLAALAGEYLAPEVSMVRIGQTDAGRLGVAARPRLGMAVIPEERIGRGAVGEMSLADNTLLTHYHANTSALGFVRRADIERTAGQIIDRRGVVSAGIDAEARSLSGGNMQKFIVGREVGLDPKILLAAHPTWGVDIGAAAAIHQALIDLAASGTGILVISEDLNELFAICDRLAVLAGGRLSPTRPIGETSTEQIGTWMAGMLDTAGGANPHAA